MSLQITRVNDFFAAYARRFNSFLQGSNLDVGSTAESFADCFIGASPLGVMCGTNDEKFHETIPKGYEFYKTIGITAMDIRSLETTLLNELHAMTRVQWTSKFIRKDGSEGSIDFEVIYFTQMLNGEPKIFAYITGDEQKVLKEQGLLS